MQIFVNKEYCNENPCIQVPIWGLLILIVTSNVFLNLLYIGCVTIKKNKIKIKETISKYVCKCGCVCPSLSWRRENAQPTYDVSSMELGRVVTTRNMKKDIDLFLRKWEKQSQSSEHDIFSQKSRSSLLRSSISMPSSSTRPYLPNVQVLRRDSFKNQSSIVKFQVTQEDPVCSVYEIPLNELDLVNRLGVGSYGEVYSAEWRGTLVAVKKLIIKDNMRPRKVQELIVSFRREIVVQNTLSHPNVVIFIGACISGATHFMVTEYMSRGNMYDFIRDKRNEYDQLAMLNFAMDIARGMVYLHDQGIMQRDLKSKNILLNEKLVVKIGDFGLSRFKDDEANYTHVGTPFWAAPEIIRHGAYSEQADVYSYGIVLWELVARSEPYENIPALQVSLKVANEGLRPPIPSFCSEGFSKLMTECWNDNPLERPGFLDIIRFLSQEIEDMKAMNTDTSKKYWGASQFV